MFKVISFVALLFMSISFAQSQTRNSSNVPCCNSQGEHPSAPGSVCRMECNVSKKKQCDGNICIGTRVTFANIRANGAMGGKKGTVVGLSYGPGPRRKGLMLARVLVSGDTVSVRSKYLKAAPQEGRRCNAAMRRAGRCQ